MVHSQGYYYQFGLGVLGQVYGGSGGITPVTYTVDDGDTVKIGLGVKSGSSATINWGDGTLSEVTNSGGYQEYSHSYVNGGTYSGRIMGVSQVTYLCLDNEAKAQFDITSFQSLTYLYLYHTYDSITGDITGMPLTYLYVVAANDLITGDITGAPLTYLYLYYTNNITGDITGMLLTYLYLAHTNNITGDITGMALTFLTLGSIGSAVTGTLSHEARLTREYIIIDNYITLPTNRSYGTWGSQPMRIDMDGHKLTADETDATLIQMAAATISGNSKTVYIYGEDRTSASDDAMTTLTNAGVTVTITG